MSRPILVSLITSMLLCGCADWTELPTVRLETRLPNADEVSPLPGAWRDPEGSEPVSLTWDKRRDLTWRTGRVHDSDGRERARVVLGPVVALLAYHAASRDPAFAGRLLPNRLASISPSDQAPVGAALLFPPGGDDPTRGELSLLETTGDPAETLAAAAALGAWAPLREAQLASGGRIPVFVPSAPGPFANLRGASLEGFLPEGLASHVVESDGLRARFYARLGEQSGRLTELADAVEALAATSPVAVPSDELLALRALLEETAQSYRTYLDSAWVELLVAQVSPDTARIALHAHTVVPLELVLFELPLRRNQALARSDAIGALRLTDQDSGATAAALLGKRGLVFPLAREIPPVAQGPYRFGSTRLRYRLEGLERSPELRRELLERLAPRIVVSASGEPLAESHLRRVLSISDRRFGAARDETLQAFLDALPSRLERLEHIEHIEHVEGDLLEVDRESWLLSLPSGSYRTRDDLIPPPPWGLRLEAGVSIEMGAGHSILVRGPLLVDGNAEHPVRIAAAAEDEPWGVLAAQGRGLGSIGARDHRPRSVVRHLELSGGSQDELRGVHYGGQLSFYHQELLLADTALRDASGEASLCVVQSQVEVARLDVTDSAGDGIQLDGVGGTLRETRILRSGPADDGLDVSKGSEVSISDSLIGEAGDECVEVGERSRLELTGVLLRGCEVGLAAKDLAVAELRQSALLGHGSHTAAYQNREVYGVGRIETDAVLMFDAEREDLATATAFSVERFTALAETMP